MNNKFINIVFLLIIIFFVFSTLHLNAATITVDTADDEFDFFGPNGQCSLREAISAANIDGPVDSCTAGSGSDEITFSESIEGETILLDITGVGEDDNVTGDLDVLDDLSIINRTVSLAGSETPEGITIDGNGTDRIFDARADLTIEGLTLQNGGNVSEGGGILTRSGATLSLTSVQIIGNIAENSSGAVFGGGIAADGPVNLFISAITDNVAETTDPASIATGGGVVIANGNYDTVVVNSIVRANTVLATAGGSAFGGGIRILGSMGSLAIVRSEISENIASHSVGVGTGGIFAGAGVVTGNDTMILNSTISSNSVISETEFSLGGGIIYDDEGTGNSLIINNSTVAANRAEGNAASAGGVRVSQGTVELSNTIIADNEVVGDVDEEGPDCIQNAPGTFISNGFNLIGDDSGCGFPGTETDIVGTMSPVDPMIEPLTDSEDLIRTHALMAGSPAIDMGDPADPAGAGTCETEDQRGEMRPFDGDGDGTAVCDIGAFELQTAAMAPGVGGSSGGSGCFLASSGSAMSFSTYFLIPLVVFIRRSLKILARRF